MTLQTAAAHGGPLFPSAVLAGTGGSAAPRCVCDLKRVSEGPSLISFHLDILVYLYYLYVFMCVCVCFWILLMGHWIIRSSSESSLYHGSQFLQILAVWNFFKKPFYAFALVHVYYVTGSLS